MTLDINRFPACRALVVGDLMVDEYVWGEVNRISPEAPVPVVNVTREEYTLGGSGNVINNLVAMGARVAAAGVVGDDAHGRRLLEQLTVMNVDTAGVVRCMDRPTIQKTRIMSGSQHVLRIDRENTATIPASVLNQIATAVEARLPLTNVMIISDYGKGLMAPSLLKRLIAAARARSIRIIVDPKGPDFSHYAGASLVTPNLKEAALSTGIPTTDRNGVAAAGKKLLAEAGIENVLITCGKDGMLLFRPGEEPLHIPAETRQVFDVSGAGDTVVATLAAALATGADYKEAAAVANTAAGIVVGKIGTATVSLDELKGALLPGIGIPGREASKIVTLEELPALAARLRRQQRTIVLTNGCFDLIHAGHLHLLSTSRNLGDVLIVAIDDDASVRAVKGPGRPIIKAKTRLSTLAALESVDYVVMFPSERLTDVIDAVRPDTLTKGANYSEDDVVGREAVERHGGIVRLVPISEALSATQIIDQIKQSAVKSDD
ncbi:MAG: D-glycero-beta-D-manno-heptose-7-phosphate kinase [Pseudomonadota bacterium]